MRVLTLDLGTTTGWAYLNSVGSLLSGSWELAKAAELKNQKLEYMDRLGDVRFYRLRDILRKFVGDVDLVVWEDVRFTTFTYQCQLWSSLRTAIWDVFDSVRVFKKCVDVSTLKKFGAKHGGATKVMMARWLAQKHPDDYFFLPDGKNGRFIQKIVRHELADDNEVDALHLMDYANTYWNKPK